MSAGWVAGSVRALAMARRRVGTAGARALAGSGSLDQALETLAHSPYGKRVHAGDALPVAAWNVAATLLWNLRVLAGWLPASGAEMLRVLAGWFEIANVDEHMRTLTSRPAQPSFPLGTLTSAWPQLHATTSRDDLVRVLTASAWGNPGGNTERDIQISMRLSWAARVETVVAPARSWARGAVALLVARERFARGQPLPDVASARVARTLGPGTTAAASVAEFGEALHPQARWALVGIVDPADLWRAELRWWRRLRQDAAGLIAGPGFAAERVIAAAALLAADAWLVRAALEMAARESPPLSPVAMEFFDALA